MHHFVDHFTLFSAKDKLETKISEKQYLERNEFKLLKEFFLLLGTESLSKAINIDLESVFTC